MDDDDALPTVSSCDDTATIAASEMGDLGDDDDNESKDEMNMTIMSCDGSALRLAQRELSSTSEQDLSWIQEPMQYKKNLGNAFEQAERDSNHQSDQDKKRGVEAVNVSDPTPSKATVASKIARFEQRSTTSCNTDKHSSTIEVFLRTRPSTDTSNTIELREQLSHAKLPTLIRTTAPIESNAYKTARGSNTSVKEFEFTGVLGETSSQEQVYDRTVQPRLAGLVEGQSALIFCYGITNAGKTHTVMGPIDSVAAKSTLQEQSRHENRGLVPRAVEDVWKLCSQSPDLNVHISYFEVYNEQIFDLLKPTKSNVFLDSSVAMSNVSRQTLNSVEQGMEMTLTANTARRSGTNRINNRSSRSHAICRLTVASKLGKDISDLWLVDLAGSERTKRTGGVQWQESVQINKSLMTLNRCLMALRSSTRPPYRESKLTQLFGAHWSSESSSRTTMIVNVNPASSDYDETQHVLRYACAARTVSLTDKQEVKNVATNVVEYGYDGRRLHKSTKSGLVCSTMKKIKKVVQKLSPMRSAKRKAGHDGDVSAKKIRLDHSKVVFGLSTSTTSDDSSDFPLNTKATSSAVVAAQEQIGAGASDILEATLQSQSSDTDAHLNSSDNDNLRELLDSVAECEAEMERMRDQHLEDLTLTTNKYETIMDNQDKNISEKDALVSELKEQIYMLESQVKVLTEIQNAGRKNDLEKQIQQLRREIKNVLTGKAAEMESKEKQITELESLLRNVSAEATKTETNLKNTIVKLEQDLTSSRAEVDSLKRQKLSDIKRNSIAKNDVENVVLGGKKMRLRTSFRHQLKHKETVDLPKRILSAIPLNQKISSDGRKCLDETASTSSNESMNSFSPSKWLKPNREVRRDSVTGAYLRPRGRAPSAADSWDARKGAWRLSMA